MTVLTLAGAIGLVAYLTAVTGFNWIPVGVVVALAVCLVLFASLTVTVTGERIKVWFGPGLIRRQFLMAEIVSCRAVRNQWFYGWGMRMTPHGWLFNVSGLDAVELKFRDGRRFRIGTDEPDDLVRAVRESLTQAVRKAN